MKLIDTPERGSPDYDPEAEYPSLEEQIESYYDGFDDYRKEEKAKWKF